MRDIHLDLKLVSVKLSGFAFVLPTRSFGFCASGQSRFSTLQHFEATHFEILLLLRLFSCTGTHFVVWIRSSLRVELCELVFLQPRRWRLAPEWCLDPSHSTPKVTGRQGRVRRVSIHDLKTTAMAHSTDDTGLVSFNLGWEFNLLTQ